jgi:transcriptional regulator with XRE-family HTH domain
MTATAERRPNYVAEDSLHLAGKHVATWRRIVGLTQAQVAARAGVSRGAVVRLEAGEPGTTVDTFFRVLSALHITDQVTDSLDPRRTALGMARADEALPKRVRKPR